MVCYNNQSKTSHYATFSIHSSDEIPKVTISFHNNLYSWNHCKEITLNNCPKPGTAIEVLLKLGILLSFLDFWLAVLPSEAKQRKALVLLEYPSEFSSIEINHPAKFFAILTHYNFRKIISQQTSDTNTTTACPKDIQNNENCTANSVDLIHESFWDIF